MTYKSFRQVLFFAALVAATFASPQYGNPSPVDPPRYDFNYVVNDYNGNDFGHQESRDGYDTQGNYYVQLPDGRLERVNYYVNGDSGFVAQVEYEGEAQYPAYQPSPSYGPSPSYQPEPSYG
ncbi:cuticle protein 19.8-like isoform X1 [Homarus americanus]|uniref:cuticle protein 19.8-like isoform X1 n=1 Tax=Homarus americanus TaxID=6706 RepID=UPI001C441D26|nr:cuticle protein 19.8-like isoform X1 [Homarus americanus]